MSPLEIVEVRAGDDPLLAAWHAVYAEARRSDVPHAVPWELHEILADLATPQRRRSTHAYAGRVAGEVVTTGLIGMPLLDNTTTATIEVGTAVAHRRRGHGTTMLDHLVSVAAGHGRRVLFAEIGYPYDAPADGRGALGPDYATTHGFTFALGDVQRELDLPVPDDVLDGLAAEAASHHDGYRIESFSGPVPERWLASYVALDAMVATDAPMGELDLEPQVADVAAHRELEDLLAAQGRTFHAAIALDGDDRVVAYTAVAATQESGECFQWGTLVDAAHRGHGLGLAVKVANVREVQAERPDVHTQITFNAESNAHMVAINDRLGFRPVARLGEFQLRLGD